MENYPDMDDWFNDSKASNAVWTVGNKTLSQSIKGLAEYKAYKEKRDKALEKQETGKVVKTKNTR